MYINLYEITRIESDHTMSTLSGLNLPPRLPDEENDALLAQAMSGDVEARDRFLAHNLRLAVHVVKQFMNTGIDDEDLFGVAQIGIMKAVSTFDITKDIRFATYATRCIQNEILMTLRNTKKHRDHGTANLDDALTTDKDGNRLTLADIVPADIPDADYDLLRIADNQLLHEVLSSLKEKNPRDFKILWLTHVEQLKQEQVAAELRISQSYVSRLEKRILKRLQGIRERIEHGHERSEKQNLNRYQEEKKMIGKNPKWAGKVKWLMENVKEKLSIADMTSIVDLSYNAVRACFHALQRGELADVVSDPTTEDLYKAWLGRRASGEPSRASGEPMSKPYSNQQTKRKQVTPPKEKMTEVIADGPVSPETLQDIRENMQTGKLISVPAAYQGPQGASMELVATHTQDIHTTVDSILAMLQDGKTYNFFIGYAEVESA